MISHLIKPPVPTAAQTFERSALRISHLIKPPDPRAARTFEGFALVLGNLLCGEGARPNCRTNLRAVCLGANLRAVCLGFLRSATKPQSDGLLAGLPPAASAVSFSKDVHGFALKRRAPGDGAQAT